MKLFLLTLSFFAFLVSTSYSECMLPSELSDTPSWMELQPYTISYKGCKVSYKLCYRQLANGNYEAVMGQIEFNACNTKKDSSGATIINCQCSDNYDKIRDTIEDYAFAAFANTIIYSYSDIPEYPKMTEPIFIAYKAINISDAKVIIQNNSEKIIRYPLDSSKYYKYSYQYYYKQIDTDQYGFYYKVLLSNINSVETGELSENGIKIYADANQNIINFEYSLQNNLSNEIKVSIFDIYGNEIKTPSIESSSIFGMTNKLSLNTSNLSKGVYLIKIQKGVSILSTKFIVN